jgi:TPR repeat protein
VPKSQEVADRNFMKRIEANDPVALRVKGKRHGEDGDFKSAFVYLSKAAQLGDVDAHYHLGNLYREGKGVEEKDEKMELHHLEEAAIGGHPNARNNLGYLEWKNGKFERGVKHLIIAANLGHDDSLQILTECFKRGLVSKDDFAAALRALQAAVDATKSPQREAAEEQGRAP